MKKELTDKEREEMNWFLRCSIEELLQKSIEEKWKQSKLDKWVRIKTAQFLEKITYAKTP